MPKTCPECGRSAEDGHRFCAHCGTGLEGVATSTETPHGYCTTCGAALTERDRFCPRCGAPASPRGVAGQDGRSDGETERFDPDDFFREWDSDPVPPDEARTEQVRLQPSGKTDTAVLPVITTEAPPQRTAAPAREGGERFPWGAAFAFAGAVAVVASSALPLASAARTILPRDVPVSALFFPDGPARGVSLGLVLLALGVVGSLAALVTMLVPRLRILRRLVGMLTLVVPVVVVVRIVGEGAAVGDLPSVLGVGVYLAFGGALAQVIAGRWLRR